MTATVIGSTERDPVPVALATFADRVWLSVGTVVLASDDGGATWLEAGDVGSAVNSLAFTSRSGGWATTDAGLFHTSDGGRTWLRRDDLPFGAATRMRFVDERHGWVTSADRSLMRTSDGGDTWDPAAQACGTAQHASAGLYTFGDVDQGWTLCKGSAAAGSEIKALFTSDDGGTTWNLLSRTSFGRSFDEPTPEPSAPVLPSGGYANDVFFLDDAIGWIAASRAGIYGTTDGGKSWRIVRMEGPVEQDARTVTFATTSLGYVIAGSMVWRTDDGGQMWARVWGSDPPPLAQVSSADIRGLIRGFATYALARIDDAHLWAVADRCHDVYRPELQQKLGQSTFAECDNHPRLMRTDDAGQHWTAYDVPGVVFDDIHARDDEHLIAFDHAAAYASSDGGRTWTRSPVDLLTGR